MDPDSSTLNYILSSLPTEVVILIFHEACGMSPTFCRSLSQTSIWTRRLALSHLWSTVLITKLNTAYSMPDILRQPVTALSDPAFIPASHVRSLWIDPISKKTIDIFTLCANLSHVALHEDNFYWLVYSSSAGRPYRLIHSSPAGSPYSVMASDVIASKPDLQLFILNARRPNWHLKQFIPVPPESPSPLFSKIRRLWIGKMGAYGPVQLNLEHFTRLTHVAVPYHSPSIQQLPSILHLLEYPGIVCLVVVILTDLLTEEAYNEGLCWVFETRKLQHKLLALPLQHEMLRTHWEEGLRPGQSVWEKAVVFTNFLDISWSSSTVGSS